jgi:hypothetical protein
MLQESKKIFIRRISALHLKTTMKSLVLTNHFFDYTGSEILALEVTEILLLNKFEVDFYANY